MLHGEYLGSSTFIEPMPYREEAGKVGSYHLEIVQNVIFLNDFFQGFNLVVSVPSWWPSWSIRCNKCFWRGSAVVHCAENHFLSFLNCRCFVILPQGPCWSPFPQSKDIFSEGRGWLSSAEIYQYLRFVLLWAKGYPYHRHGTMWHEASSSRFLRSKIAWGCCSWVFLWGSNWMPLKKSMCTSVSPMIAAPGWRSHSYFRGETLWWGVFLLPLCQERPSSLSQASWVNSFEIPNIF